MATQRRIWYQLSLICLILAIIIIQSKMLGDWIVDDAGISIAYARNLSNYGKLVSQIGAEKVEGFSNPLWVFLLAGIAQIGPILSLLKVVITLLLSWSIFRLYFGLRRLEVPFSAIIGILLLIAFQPAVIIWSYSGLENSLYLAAGIELFLRMCFAAAGKAKHQDNIIAGIAASILALTRPEGIIYLPLYLLARLVDERTTNTIRKVAFSYIFPAFCIIVYTTFRWIYFKSLLPNPYFAKGGPRLSYFIEIVFLYPHPISKLLTLSRTVFGEILQTWGLLISVALVAWRLFRFPDKKIAVVSLCFILTSVMAYMLLPSDWMPEARYATLFYPAYYFLIIDCVRRLLPNRWIVIGCFLLVISGCYSFYRIHFFSLHPSISINEVQDRSDRFTRWGHLFSIDRCSILTADAGGYLLRNDLDLVDLGMLCDRTIALSLGEGSGHHNIQRFYDYVFDERKPTFIEIRAYHSWLADLDGDKRFRRDYAPIREYIDTWVKKRYGEIVYSGDFIRRDVLDQYALETIKIEAASLSYPFCGRGIDH